MVFLIMSLERLSNRFCYWAEQSLEKLAAAKKKSKQVAQRNRGKCVFPAESSRLKDRSKDRYPINNIDQARTALRYAGKQKSAPWFNGTVESMKKAVQNAVYREYPSLKQEKKTTKKSDLEVGLQKNAILKEVLDRNIDDLMRQVEESKHMANNILGKLDVIKSSYTVEFNPELEHFIVERMGKMEEVSRNGFAYLNDLHKRIDELLRKLQKRQY